MKKYRLSVAKRVIALAVFVGALPFLNNTRAYAGVKDSVGLTYGAQATLNSTYIWRGLYAGGMNIQASANVGYAGLYADLWWNVGVTNWGFKTFQPEVDISLGFKRWGVDVFLLYIHNFNCGFFDFANYADRGNRLEINARYTISDRIPLTIAWATRISAADGYLNDRGELRMAYSSYAEVSYTQALPYDLSLRGAIGITPWRSCYTGYKRHFAVQTIDIRLRKEWEIAPKCGLHLTGQLCINPSALAADKKSAEWHPLDPGNQSINANIAVGVYLK